MNRGKLAAIAILLALALTVPVQAAQPTTTRPVYATPQDVMAAYQEAIRAGDYANVFDLLTENGQKDGLKFIISSLLPDVVPVPSSEPINPKVTAFENKYRLDLSRRAGQSDDQTVDRIAASIKDQRDFFIEFFAVTANPAVDNAQPQPVLTDVHVDKDGMTANGTLAFRDPDGSTMSEDSKFKKIIGSWKLEWLAL